MATSLTQARRIGATQLVRYGQEAKNWLRTQGVSMPKESSIYVDSSGFVSYKGKAVRERDGSLIPYGSARLTSQGEATRQLEQSAANRKLAGMVGVSRTVTSREQLARRDAEIAAAKAEQRAERERIRRDQLARERAEREAKERAAREAAAINARSVAAKQPRLGTLGDTTPLQPQPAVPRPEPAGMSPTPAARRFVGFRGIATEHQGITVLLLKPS